MVRLGIIGIGNMGSTHTQSILSDEIEGLQLTAVCDINPARLDWVRSLPTSGGVAYFDQAEALMDSGLVDAVLIATPHYEHPPLAVMAFGKGLHVLSEKPAGVYTKAVRLMNETAQKSGKVFGIMFNQRTDSLYRKMREIVQGGSLGAIKRTNWLITNWYRPQSYYDSGAWRATWGGEGGGVLLNQCPHNLDLWQWICGMPNRVRAFCHNGKWHDIEVEDDVTAYVEYANGATGVFVTSTGDVPGTNRFEVLMEGGKLVCEEGKLIQYTLEMTEKEFSRTFTGGFGEPKFTVQEVQTDGQNPQHAGILRDFTRAIETGEPLHAPGVEGINGLMISNAMHLSSWLERTVDLPIDEDLFYQELQKRVATSRIKTGDGKVLDTSSTYGS